MSTNWKSGGNNSLRFSAFFSGQAYYLRGASSWGNEANLLYAGQYTHGQGYRKTNDHRWLTTKYGRALSPKWNALASLKLLSQLAPATTTPRLARRG